MLSERIYQFRRKSGLSQEQLAEKLNISQRTLSGIECGANFLTAQTLNKIFEVLEITPDDLFYLNYLKPNKELVNELISDIKMQINDTDKLHTIYKVVKAIIKD